MSDDLIALFRGAVEAWNRGDRDDLISRFAPDARMATAADWPGGGRFTGHAEINGFLDDFAEAWEVIEFEIQAEPRRLGDCVLCPSRWAGRGRESGIEATLEFYALACFERGLIARYEVFWTEAEALAALETHAG